ncbi:hypothetical protein C1637_21035 [Chryseobacterium lactis]|uniref:Uncharacterized protein n=1 Tax=Chryseobacterium lactis TaxID=1241981 RepID=A0A3G6RPL6_CHRLC|nr:hypothetical protein [Chryseobacterium lactis]AZA83442.1 hypothetical protein EG342_16825 [Chryseobacterium lactis]AZB03826.1 hypothetical protein EG341_07700 [Chryseobacterium lactis]PNW11597.1 hypothetical protein C1637_21035 [Chryseobacterium lactis]
MIEHLSVLPDIYKGVFTGVVGAVISGIVVYLNEKSKRRALLNDNKRLVEETEKIKADFNRKLEGLKRDYELDISKRKYRYESKKASYIGFFQKLDQLNAEMTVKSVAKMQEMTQKFTESCLYAQSDEENNEGILQYQLATQSILMESQQDINKLKHETSEIKLHASSQIIDGLNKLEYVYERIIQEGNLLIQKMPTIILSGDSNLMTLNQQDLIKQAAEAEIIKENLIKNMRQELDEI